jgi:cellulose synthase operon protein C
MNPPAYLVRGAFFDLQLDMRRTLNVKFVVIIFASLLMAGIGVHFLHGYQVQRNAYRLLERGDQAVADKKDDNALAYYAQYLSLVPEDVDTLQKYANVLDRTAVADGERVHLILRMEQILRVKPNEQQFRLRLVHNLIALDRFGEAIDHLKRLEKTWTDKAEVLHMIGWCQEAMNDYRAAAKSFEEAIRINPKQTRSYVLAAEVYELRLNQPEDAQRIMDELVRVNADAYQPYLMRARLQRQRGDDKLAQADLQTAYKLAPDQAEVILEVADAARAAGDLQEATRLLTDGIKRFPDQAVFYQGLAWVKVRTNDNAEAIKHVKDGLRRAPASNELAVLLIDLMIDQKQYQEARAKIDELLKAGWNPTLPNYLKARLAVADKNWHEAIKLLASVRKDLGESSQWHGRVYALLGQSYRNLRDHEQELQAFRKAVQHEPAWMTANLGLATALLNNGRFEEASQTLEALRKVRDLPPEYWILQCRVELYRESLSKDR